MIMSIVQRERMTFPISARTDGEAEGQGWRVSRRGFLFVGVLPWQQLPISGAQLAPLPTGFGCHSHLSRIFCVSGSGHSSCLQGRCCQVAETHEAKVMACV